MAAGVVHVLLLVTLPPLLMGVIGRIKAWMAGRTGPPLLQPYRDIARLLRKGAVYSRTVTWVFVAGPAVSLASVFTAGLLLPLASVRAPMSFEGDLVLFAYLLALGRFFTMAAALDTGSSFEGMGASREAAFSALAEPALFLALATLAVTTGQLSLSEILGGLDAPRAVLPAILLSAAALSAVLLAENARIPIDDPATHLELTMVHEVMVLDHSGPDLAMIEYASAVKLFITSTLLAAVAVPGLAGRPVALAAGALGVACIVGLVESVTARLRLPRVKQFLIGASALGAVALATTMFTRGAA
ncbi:MAG: NADH-quinone oxidoreductase subunit H [Deltaproteobacteria bacterium]|nr:NADH-quinone oxidoreductase subunit H [Deltaproteobacteria bacterium]